MKRISIAMVAGLIAVFAMTIIAHPVYGAYLE
jgi:hypothetical protein